MQAAARPAGTRCAAARAARSAAAWARWRPTTADPTQTPPTVIAARAAIRKAPSTDAAPESSRAGFHRGDRVAFDDQPGQQRRPAGNAGDDIPAIRTQFHDRTPGRHDRRCAGRHRVASRGKPGRFPGCIDAPDLHRQRRDTGSAQHQDHHQCGDGKRRLDRAETGFAGGPDNAYTREVSARAMMLVKAPTIESPVTTL